MELLTSSVDELAKQAILESSSTLRITESDQEATQLVFFLPMYLPTRESCQSLLSLVNQLKVQISVVVYVDLESSESRYLYEFFKEHKNVHFFIGKQFVGQLIATNVARKIALNLFGASKYYALASDHDFWNPEFASRAISGFEKNPESVLWVPHVHRIDKGVHDCKKEQLTPDSKPLTIFQTFCRCNKKREKISIRHPKNLSSENVFRRLISSHRIQSGSFIYGVEKGVKIAEYYLCSMGPDQFYLQRLLCSGPFIFDHFKDSWIRVQRSPVSRQRSINNLFPPESLAVKRPRKVLLYFHRFHHVALATMLFVRNKEKSLSILLLLQIWIILRVSSVSRAMKLFKLFKLFKGFAKSKAMKLFKGFAKRKKTRVKLHLISKQLKVLFMALRRTPHYLRRFVRIIRFAKYRSI